MLLADAIPTSSEYGLMGLLLVLMAAISIAWINKRTSAPPPTIIAPQPVIPTDQLIQIIQENSETNAKLVQAIESQTRIIGELAQAVHRLIGKLGS